MNEKELEMENFDLRRKVAVLQAAKAKAEEATRSSDLAIKILILKLVNDHGIHAVPHRNGADWELLTRGEFDRRYGETPFAKGEKEAGLPRRKTA